MPAFRAPLSLRGQVSTLFALGALIVSTLVGLSTAVLTHSLMVEQRQRTSQRQTAIHTAVVAGVLTTAPRSLDETLRSLDRPIASYSLARVGGRWHASSPTVDPGDLPGSVVAAATAGRAATVRATLPTGRSLAVVRPLPQPGAGYIEVFSLADIEQTRHVQALVLVVVGAVVTALATVLGRWVATVALRPVEVLTQAAAKVAAGDLTVVVRPGRAEDLRTLADAFNRTVAALRGRVERDARFAGDVSHQLRTPLTTMLTSMELLRKHREQLPEAAREPLDLLDDDLTRFRRLVLDLIEISRDDSGAPVVLEPVRLVDLVREAADAVVGRPVTTVEDGAAALVVVTDKRRLEQVVTNLVENAELHGRECLGVLVRPVPPPGAEPLDRSAAPDLVELVVDDRGPGVPDAKRERLFERFVRGERPVGTGSGLGLAIVARHVRALQGEVEVRDRPGGGARFVVRLPRTVTTQDRSRP